MPTIINRPRVTRRGIVLYPDGHIILRSRPCKLLHLNEGDAVSFMLGSDGQLYVFKDNDNGLRLHGRPMQLHCCSVDTVRTIIKSIPGTVEQKAKIELITSNKLIAINVPSKGVVHALAVINRI